ncbi:MAG: hypothetical protein LBC65_02555 [Oscillospiraceae bacterium]|jgi:hypothetical protein|nr:hypothetical protein [Oscillospiraceae bacterium]
MKPPMFRPRVYKPKPPLKRALSIIAWVLGVTAVVSLLLFFWLRSCAVYLPDGSVELHLPWGIV